MRDVSTCSELQKNSATEASSTRWNSSCGEVGAGISTFLPHTCTSIAEPELSRFNHHHGPLLSVIAMENGPLAARQASSPATSLISMEASALLRASPEFVEVSADNFFARNVSACAATRISRSLSAFRESERGSAMQPAHPAALNSAS